MPDIAVFLTVAATVIPGAIASRRASRYSTARKRVHDAAFGRAATAMQRAEAGQRAGF